MGFFYYIRGAPLEEIFSLGAAPTGTKFYEWVHGCRLELMYISSSKNIRSNLICLLSFYILKLLELLSKIISILHINKINARALSPGLGKQIIVAKVLLKLARAKR